MSMLEFTGLKELEPLEQTIVKGIAQEYYPLLQRDVHQDVDILVHVKTYNKGGHKSKYSIHLKLIYAGNVLNVDKVHDWDLPRGVHEAFVALLNMAKHKFKLDPLKWPKRKSTNKSWKQIKRRERQVKKDKRKSSVRRRALKKRRRTT